MMIADAAFVLVVVGLVVYAILRVVTRTPDAAPSERAGQWLATHYDLDGQTVVVLRKTSLGRAEVLDEHLVATILSDDPDYDATFLAAMAAARERRALFEGEEE